MNKRTVLLTALLAAIVLTGCATPPKPEAKKAADDEYVYLPPATGSHVQRKVLKSDLLAGRVPNDDQAVDKDQFARSINPGIKVDHGH